MAKLTKREQNLIVATLLFAVVFLVAYLYYFPLSDEIKELEQQSIDLDFKLDEVRNIEIMIESTSKKIQELEEELTQSREFLMDTIDEAEILKYVSDIVLADGSLSSLSYGSLSNNDTYYSKDISLNFTSSYRGLKNILRAFETGEIFTLIPSISLSPIGNEVEIVETVDEDGETIVTETVVENLSIVNVSCTIRFYAEESTWDGSGEYDFMSGSNFGKNNIFR